jgi:hypothetical protein
VPHLPLVVKAATLLKTLPEQFFSIFLELSRISLYGEYSGQCYPHIKKFCTSMSLIT